MATTGVNFVATSATVLSGAATTASPVLALNPAAAQEIVNGGGGVFIDKIAADLSAAGYAKNAGYALSLSASTPITVDHTAISSAATASVGDNSFTTINELIFVNPGTHDVTVGAAGSTPLLGPLAGTTPTFTVPAGSVARWKSAAGWTVSGANNLKFNPGSNACTIYVAVGGA